MNDTIKILLVKYLLNTCNSKEKQDVENWINEADENRVLYREMEAAWKLGERIRKLYCLTDPNEELLKFQKSLEYSTAPVSKNK